MAKVLLVEDNEMNRDMLSRRLERKGYEVLIAIDGSQGVSMGIENKPDIILIDMSLPVIDGWTATQQLKNNPETQALVSSSWTLETSQYKKFNKASEFEASPPKLTLFQEYRGLQQELF